MQTYVLRKTSQPFGAVTRYSSPGLLAGFIVTTHRHENIGEPLVNICRAIEYIATVRPDVKIVFPVHPNPAIETVVRSRLAGLRNIHLLQPIDFPEMVKLTLRASVVLTDSAGLQEEAMFLQKNLLILRQATERPPTNQWTKLVEPTKDQIVQHTLKSLDMAPRHNLEHQLNIRRMSASQVADAFRLVMAGRSSKNENIIDYRMAA